MQAYKVVRKENGKLVSALPSSIPVEYVVGEKTYPVVGQLFAFYNHNQAHRFALTACQYMDATFDVYQCEVEPTKKIKLYNFLRGPIYIILLYVIFFFL